MPVLTESPRDGGFIVSEANGFRSREPIIVASGASLLAGAVLGQILFGAATAEAAAGAGNTGNGALTLADPATGAGVKAGVYRLVCIEPASNAGKFAIEDPDGVTVGIATVAVAYDGVIKFTIADGGTDFVAGDSFDVTVEIAEGSLAYDAWDPTASNGLQTVAGVLFGSVDATDAAKPGVREARDAEVVAADLIWFDGAEADDIAAGIAGLAELGIIAR